MLKIHQIKSKRPNKPKTMLKKMNLTYFSKKIKRKNKKIWENKLWRKTRSNKRMTSSIIKKKRKTVMTATLMMKTRRMLQ